MFTLFDLAALLLPFVCAVTLATWGHRLGGVGGALVGALLGVVLGRLAARLLTVVAFRPVIAELRSKPSEELKAALRDEACLTPNLVLLELKSRDQVSDDDLEVVVEMLRSEKRRTFGWAALTSAYPELAATIPGYSPVASRESCAVSIERLEAEIKQRRRLRDGYESSPGSA